jgi:hypothetical protein
MGAPAQTDPTRVAVYASSLQAGGSADKASPVTSAAISTMTVWGSYGGVLNKETDLALSAVGAFSKGPAVSVQVILPNPEPAAVIQLKEYPLDALPGGSKDLKFSFTLEVTSAGAPEKGLQTFKDPLTIILRFPEGSKPFFLANEKNTRVYLKDMVVKPESLPDFNGSVKPFGQNGYIIEVHSWQAGDPCCSG